MISSLAHNVALAHLSKRCMEGADAQQGGDNRCWRKHVSSAPQIRSLIDAPNVQRRCRQCELWVCAGAPGERERESDHSWQREKAPAANRWGMLGLLLRNQSGKRDREKCEHMIIPLLNLVCTSSQHLVCEEVEEVGKLSGRGDVLHHVSICSHM